MAKGLRRVPTYYQDIIDIIGANPGHVIGSTACLGGVIPTQLLKYKQSNDNLLMQKIKNWIITMSNIFQEGNFFLELQPSNNKDQIYVNNKLIELSKELKVPFIITTDSHYLSKKDRNIHKIYLNAQNGEREVDDFYATTYMMNTEELENYMKISKEDLQIAYNNILKIKDMCEDYNLEKPLKIPRLKWKINGLIYINNKDEWIQKIPYLKIFWDSDFDGDKLLADKIVTALLKDKRLQNKETYDEVNDNLRITYESSITNNTHWSAYYLNLQNIIDLVWKAGSLVGPGRGSGVGFLLLYLLEITQINPLWEDTKTYSFRFLNPERVSVLDIDFDSEGGRRSDILECFKKEYGSNRVSGVATFGSEKSKSAIQTACRGLGIDPATAQYLASLIPEDRGKVRTLHQCMFGDTENGWEPVKQFVNEMSQNYPEVWEVSSKIEGLVNRLGSHAGGVIFKDEDFTESVSLMRTPKGEIITAYDLHDVEYCGDIKYDVLSVEGLDKIHNCLDLLMQYGYIEDTGDLKQTYNNTIGIYKIERDAPKMWEMIWNHQITSLFQMEKESGTKGIALVLPKSVKELATLNSVIRLMAPEKGAEQPLDMWARYRNNINDWYKEMSNYGLSEEEIQWLANYPDITDGIAESQECLMKLVQEQRLGGNNLNFADKCRKGLAKKDGPLFKECELEYFKNAKEKGCSEKLVHYVWDVLLRVQRNYSFNKSHTLAYSLVALQEMNLAYYYPIIFWNCACLITDSGGNENDTDTDLLNIDDDDNLNTSNYDPFVDFYEEENEYDDDDDDDNDDQEGQENLKKENKKAKKTKTNNYGKIASSIGKFKADNINISLPDINYSTYTFSPDVENNIIRYGLSGISRIGEDLIKEIINNRPYTSIEDFQNKVKVNKVQMINLIKGGLFDKFGERKDIMKKYIISISNLKQRITLQNMKTLIEMNLLPETLSFEIKVYNFNKYLKKFKIDNYYELNEIAFNFYEQNFDLDNIKFINNSNLILQKTWDKIYDKYMDNIRNYIKSNKQELLEKINTTLINNNWNKYCQGSYSKWEMDSVSFYYHEHELANLQKNIYSITNFIDIPENPVIDRIISIKGKQIPLLKLYRIAGTVLDKNKQKKTITLLTNDGQVVNVKIYGQVFSYYDKQISEKDQIGKKHVVEKSMFNRGNKLIITGIRQQDGFLAKKYSKTNYPLVELITKIYDNGYIETKSERAG